MADSIPDILSGFSLAFVALPICLAARSTGSLSTIVDNRCWAGRASNALLAISDSGLAPSSHLYYRDGNDDTLFVAADPRGISGPTANPLNRQHRAASQLIQPPRGEL